nr:hypothetical protein [Glutamicibacter sp.]
MNLRIACGGFHQGADDGGKHCCVLRFEADIGNAHFQRRLVLADPRIGIDHCLIQRNHGVEQ